MARPETEVRKRAQRYARHADLRPAVAVLRSRRDEVLERWVDAVAAQPCHRGRRERAVADDIPGLFDSLMDALERGAPVWLEPEAPLDNPAVAGAAQRHAAARASQGLQPADVVVEFRLLRQEIWRALRLELPDNASAGDLLGAQLLLNDAIDGAMGVALTYFVLAIEELKNDFLLTATHDLRTPLTSLKGTAQLLARHAARPEPDLERIRQGLAQIDAQATRMATLITALLDASRLRLGRFEITPTPTQFRTVLDRVVSRFEPTIAPRIRVHAPPDSMRTGQWDATRLEEVLENLLSNAVKFSPPDSPIVVQVAATTQALTVAIRDYGRGLDSNECSRVFDRFYRSPSLAGEQIDGSGLGLYIVHGIVEAHGGHIWAASPGRDQGCTFQFTLPWQAPTH
jgi:signal transduction histidine kinase